MKDNIGSNRSISSLIRVADDIAFRANLLALNASVLMAGGGEDGLEFALAADKVRNLARRGVQAANASPLVEQEQTF
jgi:methyl-accepting chemotaxis protein